MSPLINVGCVERVVTVYGQQQFGGSEDDDDMWPKFTVEGGGEFSCDGGGKAWRRVRNIIQDDQ